MQCTSPGRNATLTSVSALTPPKRLETPTASTMGADIGTCSEVVVADLGPGQHQHGVPEEDLGVLRRDCELVVTLHAEVGPVGELLAVDQQLGRAQHRLTGELGIPQVDRVDRA